MLLHGTGNGIDSPEANVLPLGGGEEAPRAKYPGLRELQERRDTVHNLFLRLRRLSVRRGNGRKICSSLLPG